MTTTEAGACTSSSEESKENEEDSIIYVLPASQETDYRYNLDSQDVATAFEFGGFFEDYGGYANYRCEQ